MIKLDFTQDIKAPVEKVFSYVTDFRNNPKWQDGILESSQDPDGPTRVGTKVTDRRSFLGQKMESTLEVTEFVPNQKMAFKSTSGPAQVSFTQLFEPAAGGTRVSMHVEMEGEGFFKLAEGALAGNLKKSFESQSQKLKSLLEA